MSDTPVGPVDPLALATAASTPKQYNQALDALRRSCGLSYQEISANTAGLLPKSTAHNLCTRETLPSRTEQIVQFVLGCGQDRGQAALWVARWEQLRAQLRHAEIRREFGPLPQQAPGAPPEPVAAGDVRTGRVRGWIGKLLPRAKGGR